MTYVFVFTIYLFAPCALSFETSCKTKSVKHFKFILIKLLNSFLNIFNPLLFNPVTFQFQERYKFKMLNGLLDYDFVSNEGSPNKLAIGSPNRPCLISNLRLLSPMNFSK